jgi:hypothetical protein
MSEGVLTILHAKSESREGELEGAQKAGRSRLFAPGRLDGGSPAYALAGSAATAAGAGVAGSL